MPDINQIFLSAFAGGISGGIISIVGSIVGVILGNKMARKTYTEATDRAFCINLPEIKRIEFDKVWAAFYYGREEDAIAEHSDEHRVREIYRKRINELFKFTDPEYALKEPK